MIWHALLLAVLAVAATAAPAYGLGYYHTDGLHTTLNPGESEDLRWFAMDSTSDEYIPVTFSVSGKGAQFITFQVQNGQVKRGESFPAEFTISIPEDAIPGKYPTRIHVQGPAPQVPNAINIQPVPFQPFTITVRGDPPVFEASDDEIDPGYLTSGLAAPLHQLAADLGPGDVVCNGDRRLYISHFMPLCLLPSTHSTLDGRGYPFQSLDT